MNVIVITYPLIFVLLGEDLYQENSFFFFVNMEVKLEVREEEEDSLELHEEEKDVLEIHKEEKELLEIHEEEKEGSDVYEKKDIHHVAVCQGPAVLKRGWKSNKRYLTLFNDVLVVSSNM